MSQNHVFIVGRVGREPRLSKTLSGQAVCNLSVATERKGRDSDVTKTDWHRVVLWGALAEFCARNLAPGAMVAVQGRLQYRKWKDNEGQMRFGVDVVANQASFLKVGDPLSEAQSRLPLES